MYCTRSPRAKAPLMLCVKASLNKDIFGWANLVRSLQFSFDARDSEADFSELDSDEYAEIGPGIPLQPDYSILTALLNMYDSVSTIFKIVKRSLRRSLREKKKDDAMDVDYVPDPHSRKSSSPEPLSAFSHNIRPKFTTSEVAKDSVGVWGLVPHYQPNSSVGYLRTGPRKRAKKGSKPQWRLDEEGGALVTEGVALEEVLEGGTEGDVYMPTNAVKNAVDLLKNSVNIEELGQQGWSARSAGPYSLFYHY
ncbi:hypothetical protein R3P38DRAFT_2816358 [Favolaschia claudopus]|uniref:Uncharacterized protein n=1 Tax=Favolaschia claudopus TaxID=2862362 RepID=A0AAV9YZ77_9AGAR